MAHVLHHFVNKRCTRRYVIRHKVWWLLIRI